MPGRINGLDKPPPESRVKFAYVWVDYIELLCLTHIDRQFSRADVKDNIDEATDLGLIEGFIDEEIEDETVFLPDEFQSDESELDFYLGEPYQTRLVANPATLDASEELLNSWFQHLEQRQYIYGEFYPFRLVRGALFGIKDTELTAKHRLYIFMLLASSQKYIADKERHLLTANFERICMVALKQFLPQQGIVELVGKNPFNRGRFAGNIWHKINLLSDMINEPISASCKQNMAKLNDPNDTGDRGLDIVGYIPFSDNERGSLLLFAQCACGKKWTEKQFEAHVIMWKKYIEFASPPINIIFISYAFRGGDGQWFDYMQMEEGILMDRQRIISKLGRHISLTSRFSGYEDIVDYFLADTI
ncbi:MAG: hypothetical protein AAF614_22050 [Chloroflexota bacterium]